jgi:hypothetical protein
MYRLLYIDEDQEQIENFLNYIDDTNSNNIFEVITQLPLGDREEMIDKIIKIKYISCQEQRTKNKKHIKNTQNHLSF